LRGHKRIAIHPLFFLVGIASAFTGRLLIFVIATVAAVEHECAHAFMARRYGFGLNKIVLMPYGAVVKGDLDGITTAQELCVLAAGPLSNALTALAFAALWWLFPQTYPYTDVAAYVSVSLAVVNLIPAYPLDGGRMLRVLLKPLGKARARTVCLVVTWAVIAGLVAWFVVSCFHAVNVSVLAFAVMLAGSAFGGGSYERMTFSRDKSFLRGIEERRIAISAEKTVGEAMRFLREDKYLVFVLFSDGEFFGELTEEEFVAALQRGDYGSTLKEVSEG